jgi:hypothetical protein
VTIVSRFDFLRFFFLADADELEVALVFEPDEDANSILPFKLICDERDIVVCSNERLAVASPARVLVIRPASSTQSYREVFVDVRAVVAIAFDVVGAEVVLQD